MLIRETFINQTKGYRFGDSGWYEAYTDDVGKLFRSMQREYGRCASSVYIDPPDGGNPIRTGWVFEKRMKYEDARGNDQERDYYVREVWVQLADTVVHHPATDTVVPHAMN
jgi:hypothetical protein